MLTTEECLLRYRYTLRILLDRKGVSSNPAVSDDWILSRVTELLGTSEKGTEIPTPDRISSSAKELLESVRVFSRSQSAEWQKVPYLALEADGRTGYSDQYSRAYSQGYWAIDICQSSGYYTVYVDLETGELVSSYDPRKKAHDEDVLRILSDPKQIDAHLIVQKLRERAKQPVGSYYNPDEQKKWRKRLRREYKLKPDTYVRKVSPEEVHKINSCAGFLD